MKQLTLLPFLLLAATAQAKPQPILYYTPPAEGFVWDWLVSFNHTYPYSYVGASMEYDALASAGTERGVRPTEGQPAAKGTNWQAYHHELGSGFTGAIVQFPPHSMHMTYAATYIVCEREYQNVSLCTGSDDGLLVLLNGQVVQKVQMQRGYNVDQDRADGLTLRRGWNTLLCKVDDYMGGHGLVLRFKTADEKPLTDFRVVLVPEPQGREIEFVDGKRYEADAGQLLKQAVGQKTMNNDAAGALRTARQVVEKYPAAKAAAEALFTAAKILEEQGKADEAIATLDALLKDYPLARWAEDSYVLKARIAAGRDRGAEAVAALETLLARYEKSALVPEALLLLADIKTKAGQLIEARSVLEDLRQRFPQTLESVQALDRLADNRAKAQDLPGAKKLWQQVIEEADALAAGKYIWYVNVQAALKDIADGARAKLK